MNSAERRLLTLLERGRDQYGVVAVKAEFEAEGTRPDEFLRLIDLARRAKLKVALKIGGCEAVSDLLASKLYGVDYIIAPMVETPYALTKFIASKDKTHAGGEYETKFLFNVETDTTLRNISDMMPIAKAGVDGVVFGRVDFTLSRGMPRGAVNDRSITEAAVEVARACVEAGQEIVVGGSIDTHALDALREIRKVRLDRFETRKVIFDGSAVESRDLEAGIADAVEFELGWLENKRAYYGEIAAEDAARIAMIKSRMSAKSASRLASFAA